MSANDEPNQAPGAQPGLGDVAGAGGGVVEEPGLVGAGAAGTVQEQGVPAGSGSPAQEVQMSGEDSDIGPADEEEGAAVEEANQAQVIDAHLFPMDNFRLEFLGLVHSVLRRFYYHNHILMWPRDSPDGHRPGHGGRNRSRGGGDRGVCRSCGAQGQSRGAGAGEGPSWGALPQLEDAPIQAPALGPGEPANQMHQAPEPEQPEDASHQASAPQLEAAQPGASQSQWATPQQEATQYQPENSDEETPKPGDEEEKDAEGETEKESEGETEKETEEETEKENEQEPPKSLDAAQGRHGNSSGKESK